jgi:probable HAF family extracellular repeat protein
MSAHFSVRQTIPGLAVTGLAVTVIGLTGPGAVLPAASSPAASRPVARIHDLGTLGGAGSQAVAINNRSQVVGDSTTTDGSTHAFVWSPARPVMRDLGPGSAVDINASGRVLINDAGHVVVWGPREGRRDLGTFGGDAASANDLNEAGQIVGAVYVAVGSEIVSHAFRWDPRRGFRDLGVGVATAVNRTGQVAGIESETAGFFWDPRTGRRAIVMSAADGVTGYLVSIAGINDRAQVIGTALQAFLWEPGSGARSLNTLDAMSSDAADINDRGQVVGRVQVPSEDVDHAYRWTAKSGMVDLTTGDDFAFNAQATAINERGEVVGSTMTSDGPSGGQAFLWRPSGGLQLLGGLDGSWSTAVDVNDRGWVAGISAVGVGSEHAVVWYPQWRWP